MSEEPTKSQKARWDQAHEPPTNEQSQHSEQAPPQPWLNLPCGCTIEKDDKMNSSVFWNEFSRVVQCHKCGQLYEPVPQRSKQQEWTLQQESDTIRIMVGPLILGSFPIVIAPTIRVVVDSHNASLAAERQKSDNLFSVSRKHCVENQELKKQLNAERQRTFEAQQAALKEGIRAGEIEQQLLSAQVAIKKHNKTKWPESDCFPIKVDLSTLHQHDAELTIKVRTEVAGEQEQQREHVTDILRRNAQLNDQLLSALAAIKKHNNLCQACQKFPIIAVDLSALHEHDKTIIDNVWLACEDYVQKVRKPLVDALNYAVAKLPYATAMVAEVCRNALAKVKESL